MNPRERVVTTLRRQVPDRVPKWISFSALLQEKFQDWTGANDPQEYFDLELRKVSAGPTKKDTDFSPYIGKLAEGTPVLHSYGNSSCDEWGIGYEVEPATYYSKRVSPMKGFDCAKQVEEYPFPDLGEAYRYAEARERVEAIHDKGYAVVAFEISTIFEIGWYLRGFEELMMDMLSSPEMAEVLFERLTEIRCKEAEHYASAGVDLLALGDDIGMQDGPMISPTMWREWLKPRLARVIESAKSANPDVLISYHSDGKVDVFIDELIEVGIDVLNPVQPECMDPVGIKERYGDRVAFWGTIGIQRLMPFGTPEEIGLEVKRMIDTVGKGGGLLISPTHRLQREVPWENIKAFAEAVDRYGTYKE